MHTRHGFVLLMRLSPQTHRAHTSVTQTHREACRTCVGLLMETGVTAELRCMKTQEAQGAPADPRTSTHPFSPFALRPRREQLLASARECFAGRAAAWIRAGDVATYMAMVEVRA